MANYSTKMEQTGSVRGLRFSSEAMSKIVRMLRELPVLKLAPTTPAPIINLIGPPKGSAPLSYLLPGGSTFFVVILVLLLIK